MRPASILILIAALLVLVETLYFASLQPGYSHVTNTISELGATGTAHARAVAFGFFLPVGLLVWLALWLVHRQAPDGEASLILIGLSCLGTGYTVAAFFPCDTGAPLFGTWRMQIHNLAGFVDYEGTGLGLLLLARRCARRHAVFHAVAFLIAAALVFSGLALLSTEIAFPIRGAIQRGTEIVQFTGVFLACIILPNTISGQKMSQLPHPLNE